MPVRLIWYVALGGATGSALRYLIAGWIQARSGSAFPVGTLIVNISGSSGLRGYKNRAAYSSSKWALRGLTRTAALDAGPYNVNVNAVHPGIVDGPRMQRLCHEKARKRGWTPEQVYDEYVQEMALRRVTSAQDVAETVCFLASDASKNITGQSIAVDGGWDV